MSIFINDLTITQFIFYTFFILKSTLNYKIPKSLHYVLKGERSLFEGGTRFLERKACMPTASRKELRLRRQQEAISANE
ncbi:MAG: hypothetical protein IJV70_04850, partial [Clostridia bacterium]|nr:hypothetical protein [Clostridia bacterium]